MSNFQVKIIVIGLSLYVLAVLLIHLFEYMSLYHPVRMASEGYNSWILHEDHYIQTDDGVLINLWFFPYPSSQHVILLCHGNGGNNSHRMEQIKALYERAFSVAIFDYRGYGKSSGHPSEKGLYKDGHAAIRFLTAEKGIPANKITVIGTSLGGAVAAELACHYRFHALVLESTFTSKFGMAEVMLPVFPMVFFSRNQFNTLEKMSRIQSPVMIVHGTQDEMIPFSMSRELFSAAPEPKFLFPVHGAHHNDCLAVGGKKYLDDLSLFVNSLTVH